MTARCLIVDDDDDIATMLEQLARTEGVEAIKVSSGAGALAAYWKAVDEKDAFDAIFLDIALPIMDGLTVARRIREAERQMRVERRAFIFAFTGHPEDVLSQVALAKAQLDRYTTKPGDLAELKDIMRRVQGRLECDT